MNHLTLSLFVIGCASATPVPRGPCTRADDSEAMALKAAECKARVERECNGVPDDECPAVHECDEWVAERCQ